MRRDPTQFRERFKAWKTGEKVYDKGLPCYDGGKDSKTSFNWTRVIRPNGNYGYVRTKNNKPIDFDEETGYFNIFEQPSMTSPYVRGYKNNYNSYTPQANNIYNGAPLDEVEITAPRIGGIQRVPDDHDAYLAQQRAIDTDVNSRTVTPERFAGMMGLAVPTAAASLAGGIVAPTVVDGVSALGYKALTNPWVDAGLTSLGGAHAIQSIKDGNANWMTALELAPLGRLIKPIYNAGKPTANFVPTIESNTIENAVSVTPEQWTAAQDAAIARGNMTEAQRLKDLHFRIKAYDNKMPKPEGWHQTNTDFNAFDLERNNNKDLDALGITGIYTKNTDADILGTQYPIQMHINRYAKNPLEIDTKTDLLDIIPGLKEKVQEYENITNTRKSLMGLIAERSNPNTTAIRKAEINKQIRAFQDDYYQQLYKAIDNNKDIIDKYLKDNNYDAVLINKDYSGDGIHNFGRYTDTEVLLSPNQIKSADAVTYDDNGVRIPLGDRDNFNINDLRYALLPFGIGLIGYGLSNWNNVKFPIKRKIK